MMPDFDKNAAFIWACYGLGAILIAATLVHALISARAARRRLAALEAERKEAT